MVTMSEKGRKIQRNKLKDSRFVPYARGFKAPSAKEKVQAIGFGDKEIPSPYDVGSDGQHFGPVPQPTSIDDWLAQYDEDGQTFKMFLDECPWISRRKVKYMKHKFVPSAQTLTKKYPEGKIYIVPLGDFDKESNIAFDDLVDYAQRFLCLPIQKLPGIKLERVKGKLFLVEESKVSASGRRSRGVQSEVDIRCNTEFNHLQMNVGSILKKLRCRVPHDALCMIGLTMYDLYEDTPDLFVAGMAAGNQYVAVFSIFRYNPTLSFSKEFWYDVRKTRQISETDKRKLVLQQSCKLVVHEICHLLGIDHCIFFDCCMNGSGHLDEDFRQPMHLCPVDLHKLQVLTGFDVINRYEKLLEFYEKHDMTTEADWVTSRIKFVHVKEAKKGITESCHLDGLEAVSDASGKCSSRKCRTNNKVKYVPYVSGYHPPNKSQCLEAIGFGKENIPKEYCPNPDLMHYTVVPRPTSIDDWLAQIPVSACGNFTHFETRTF